MHAVDLHQYYSFQSYPLARSRVLIVIVIVESDMLNLGNLGGMYIVGKPFEYLHVEDHG